MAENDEKLFTQDELNTLIGTARVKAREKATADFEAQAAKDKETADQAALTAQKEWQKLAEISQARVKELEPLEATAKAYEEMVASMLKNTIKELGEAAKTAIGALPKSMSAIDKLNWLNQNKGLFQADSDGVGTPGRPTKTETTKVKSKPGSAIPHGHRL